MQWTLPEATVRKGGRTKGDKEDEVCKEGGQRETKKMRYVRRETTLRCQCWTRPMRRKYS